jgi:YggT family protein
VLCLIHYLLLIYWLILIARIVVSWVQMMRPMPSYGTGRRIIDVINRLTDPVLKPVQGLLPPIRMGGMGLDLSPIIVFIVIGILLNAIHC